MNAAENNLLQLLTSKSSLKDATINELKEVANKYPYFSVAQLFLSKKLLQSELKDFPKHFRHCAIYFQDITWLLGQIYNKDLSNIRVNNSSIQLATSDKNVVQERSSSSNSITVEYAEKENIENSNIITLPAENVLDDFTLEMNDVKEEYELPPLDEEELSTPDDIVNKAAAKIADVLQHQVEDFKAAVVEECNLPIGAEPYHTIDYFASQGIKLDTQAQDTFSKKVHTFTDWLKQMKRISNYPIDLGSDPNMEDYVQSIADTSNQQKAVDTEAMAEVLVKQGKLDKAIEIYEKLSLLNPSKTTYFATKISQLKA